MAIFEAQSIVNCSQEQLFDFHRSAEALHRLTPGFLKVTIAGDLEVKVGSVQTVTTSVLFRNTVWIARIEEVLVPEGFADCALQSPFREWRHQHRFEAITPISTRLKDRVEYGWGPKSRAFGPLNWVVEQTVCRVLLWGLFKYRHAQTRRAVSPTNSGKTSV